MKPSRALRSRGPADHEEVLTMNAIEAIGLVKTYPGGVRALDGLSFAAEEGTVFGLVGPNGAGKSTTVRILTTLARPDEGEPLVAGLNVLERPGEVRQAIGVLAQKAGVDPEATGRENARLQGRIHGLHGRDLEDRVDALFDQFGLADVDDRLARTYSGGMQRRLDIALALVHRPRVLFLDEPTTGLDPDVRVQIWREISRLAREEGLTVLLTTHYMEEADALASRLAIIDRGQVVAQGSPDDLKAELRGDAVHVELADTGANGRVSEVLGSVTGIRDLVVEGSVLHARADNGARAVPAVLQALDSRGIPVAAVTVARPSLDDVYLRYARRTLGEAETHKEDNE
jgi:ABC-2 type transport system ATP-binding protein